MRCHLFIVPVLAFLSSIKSKRVGSIAGISLLSATDVTSINGSCAECICAMLTTQDILGVSCLQNQSCLLFHNYSSSDTVHDSPNASFHFLVQPSEKGYFTTGVTDVIAASTSATCPSTCLNNGTCSVTNVCQCTTQWYGARCELPVCAPACQNSGNCTAPGVCTCYYGWTGIDCQTVTTVLWSFDGTFNDTSDRFAGIGISSPTFTSGITGYGSALALNGSRSQCVVATPYLNMSYMSFSWEFWIYPTTTSTGDSMFVGHCFNSTPSQCMVFMTRNNTMRFSFWFDDVTSSTLIQVGKWSHMAFVYDLAANSKSLYLDGVMEGNKTGGGPLQVPSANITFGCRTTNGGRSYNSYFTGYIDQVLFNSRIKNASEILDDATLVAYFRFLFVAPLMDSGPNHINGSWGGGATSVTAGVVDQAIDFPVNGSYFELTGLVLLGTTNRSMSLSFWFKVRTLNVSSTIAHISSAGQCLQSIGLLGNGTLQIQLVNGTVTGPIIMVGVWNHLAYSFSPVQGLRLYMNGTLYTSMMTTYSTGNSPARLTFGYIPQANTCGSSFPNEQFYGSVDQIRLYSREITSPETAQLYSNP